jgi:hypothetical protein
VGKTTATKQTASFGEAARTQLSLKKCRAILGADAPELDADLSRLRDAVYGYFRVVVEAIPANGRLIRSPHAPNGASRSFDDTAKGKTEPVNFTEAVAMMSEDERYEVEERAAIYESDGGLDRNAAEQQAFLEYWRTKHNGDFNERCDRSGQGRSQRYKTGEGK